MMKLMVFGHREEETEIFEKFNKIYKYEITYNRDFLSMSNIESVKGYDAICITVSSSITDEIAVRNCCTPVIRKI